jgi:ferredoxin/coenzyme F420-reducing hydrogenase delta subunit
MELLTLPAPTAEHRIAPAFAGRCKRLRHRQNECRLCEEACPEGAITLDPVPKVSDRCTRCGLCQTACPTEVFQGEVHSDEHLLARIRPLLRPQRRTAEGRPLVVHCREAEPGQRDAVAVPCLGSVSGNFLLGAVVAGANPLTLFHGDCQRCRLREGERLFARAMAAYVALAPAVGMESSAVKVKQRQKADPAVPPRRKFFARVAGLGAPVAGDWPAPGTEVRMSSDATAAAGPGKTPGRALLQELLRGASWSASPMLRHDARLPWASLRIDQRDCATCGTCVNSCPTGALTRRIENGRLSHHFDGALCVNCRSCEEACAQQVIGFDPEFDARDLVRGEPRAITDIRLHSCEICGEMLPEREGWFCITCRRRGRVENG